MTNRLNGPLLGAPVAEQALGSITLARGRTLGSARGKREPSCIGANSEWVGNVGRRQAGAELLHDVAQNRSP
jgi:hypothetical protein